MLSNFTLSADHTDVSFSSVVTIDVNKKSFKVHHIVEHDGCVYTLCFKNGFPRISMFEIGQLTLATPNVLACMDNLPSGFPSISTEILAIEEDPHNGISDICRFCLCA